MVIVQKDLYNKLNKIWKEKWYSIIVRKNCETKWSKIMISDM